MTRRVRIDCQSPHAFGPALFSLVRRPQCSPPSQRRQFDAHLDRHRILIATSEFRDVQGAPIRHELEHVRQDEVGGSSLFVATKRRWPAM
jgi:hypothetical protein